MINNWFTNKCMTLIGLNGRALTGEALEAAELALEEAKIADHKIWTDRNGNFYHKKRSIFAATHPLLDRNGNQVRICGRMVKSKAKFCSKCGGTAPGSWWRCGGCGKLIGSESHTCPHCGREQNLAVRLDLSDGSWKKGKDVFAERFELHDVVSVLSNGLNVQENQKALLLDGGAVSKVLDAGPCQISEFINKDGGDKSLVFVDCADVVLPVCVEKILTKDDLEADLHSVIVLSFDPKFAREFMCNLMGNALYLNDDALTSALGYDEIAHYILADVDAAARDFCNNTTISELFKSADTRIALEDFIADRLARNLSAIGMKFVRLKEVEFESEVFTSLREKSGLIEIQRREIEFMKRADELANDTVRRKALSESDMEEYLKQLAHEKGIKDDLREREIATMKKTWKWQEETELLTHEYDVADAVQERKNRQTRSATEFKQELDRSAAEFKQELDRSSAEFRQELLDLEHGKELERRIAEQNATLEKMQIEGQIQAIKLDVEKKKVAAEQEAAEKWLKIKQDKKAFEHNQKIEMLNAASKVDIQALLLVEDDPEKRRDLLALYEQQQQAKMTPELLLAAAAARGNVAAAEALNRLSNDQLEAVERSKAENKEIFEKMLQMSERLFNQTTESMAKGFDKTVNTTNQIVK